jgi:hypothetical protein
MVAPSLRCRAAFPSSTNKLRLLGSPPDHPCNLPIEPYEDQNQIEIFVQNGLIPDLIERSGDIPWSFAVHTSKDSIGGDFVAFYVNLDNETVSERRQGVMEEVITHATGEGNPLRW